MARRARLNRAMLAMVSAERQRSSGLTSRRILTIVVRPPRSVIVRRISALVLISFKIFSAPIFTQTITQFEWLKVFRLCHNADRLLRLGLWTPEESRNRCDLMEVFKMFYGYTEIDIRVLFTTGGNDNGLRGHSKKICKPGFNADIRKYFFSNRVIDRWNSLDQDTVDAPSLNCFKNRLNEIRYTRMGFFMN